MISKSIEGAGAVVLVIMGHMADRAIDTVSIPAPDWLIFLICGLWGSVSITALRFQRDKLEHPITEWISSIFVGTGSAFLVAPGIVTLAGLQDIRFMVATMVAFLFQIAAEWVLAMNGTKLLEDFLASLGKKLVDRFER